MYTKRCSSSNQIQWQCSQRAAFKCNGSLYTSLENQNPHAAKPHTHEPDVKAVDVAKAKAAIKQQAKKSREKPLQILSTHLASITPEIWGAVWKPCQFETQHQKCTEGSSPQRI